MLRVAPRSPGCVLSFSAESDHTRHVISNTPFDDRLLSDAGAPSGNLIPNRPGAESPIRHVIYVIKVREPHLRSNLWRDEDSKPVLAI